MATMDIKEARAGELVRRVRDRETIDVIDAGEVVARVVPTTPTSATEQPTEALDKRQAMLEWLRETDKLAHEMAERWPKGVSAQDVIDDVRIERWKQLGGDEHGTHRSQRVASSDQ